MDKLKLAAVIGVRHTMKILLVLFSILGSLNVFAASFVYPSFEDEINCLEHRVAIVKVVNRSPTTYDDETCGNVYTFQTVESIRGDSGVFKVYSEADDLPIGEEEYFLAAVRWNPESPRRSSCYDSSAERTPCHGSLLNREICIGDDANWAVFKEQRIFRIIEAPQSTKIPGKWVAEDRDSILRFLLPYVQSFYRPFTGNKTTNYKLAYSLDDLKRLIKNNTKSSCE